MERTETQQKEGGARGGAVGGGFGVSEVLEVVPLEEDLGGGQTSGVGLEASDLGRPRGPRDKFCGSRVQECMLAARRER